MSRRANILRHGANHAAAGSDPIPGLTGGGGGAKKLLAVWGGALPTAADNGLVWRIPYDSDGSSFTFTLTRAFARIESALSVAVSFRVEKAAGGDVAFSASTVTTITIPAGDYETENTGLSTAVNSTDLLRLVYVAVDGINTPKYQVEVIGSE